MHTHTRRSLAVLNLCFALLLAGFVLQTKGTFAVGEDCVGKPYGTPGCPAFSSSSSSAVPVTCGNGNLDTGEECDDGRYNGVNACSTSCKLYVCGDGQISPQVGEECEPEKEAVYATDPATGELTTQTQYSGPVCGTYCTVPVCSSGSCSGGCKRQFLPACTASISSTAGAHAAAAADSGAALSSLNAGSSAAQSTQPSSVAPPASQSCGNGTKDPSEQCDDGYFNSNVSPNACRSNCLLPHCGDRVTDRNEECDDGNTDNTDACTNDCRIARCGDGVVQFNEQCDDGNKDNGDACTSQCTFNKCGDGIVGLGEECDDGNQTNNDSCTSLCQLPRCGDGFLQGSEQCDAGTYNSDSKPDFCRSNCLRPHCGDGIVDLTEQCDDGQRNSNIIANACRLDCTLPRCGNGVVDENEQCDDGNTKNIDYCTNDCRTPRCGDGIQQMWEECDTGKSNSDTVPDQCRTSCMNPKCGDKIIDTGEECDGGSDCTSECKKIPLVSGSLVNIGGSGSKLPLLIYILAGFMIVSGGVLFLARASLKSIVTGKRLAHPSIDDIPLNEIEMPWHKWS